MTLLQKPKTFVSVTSRQLLIHYYIKVCKQDPAKGYQNLVFHVIAKHMSEGEESEDEESEDEESEDEDDD